MDFKTLIKEESEATIEDVQSAVKEAFLKVFPKSGITVQISKLGEPSLVIRYILASDSKECSNGIIQNDPMFTVIQIDAWNKDGSFKGKYKVENDSNSGFSVKAPPESRMAFERVKFWRNFTVPSKDKLITNLTKYFDKLKSGIADNLDRLPEYAKDKI
jgi:hypothetical protein